MTTKELGKSGLFVPRLGLGTMGMTAFYTFDSSVHSEDESLKCLARAVELAAPTPAFLDTAYIYVDAKTGAANETLVGKAIAAHGRAAFVVATKCGIVVTAAGTSGLDSSPAGIRAQLATSLSRLGTDYVDLYYQHRPDPNTPIEIVVATFKELIAEGKIRHYGLSECSPDELHRAHAIHPCAAIQMEYSLNTREIETSLLPAARALGVAVVAYSPLGRGLLSRTFTQRADLAPGDWRLSQPRFSAENFEANVSDAEAFARVAARLNVAPATLALAWLLAQGGDIFPIPGTKATARLEENWAAIALSEQLSPADLAAIEAAVPKAAGDRYASMTACWEARV